MFDGYIPESARHRTQAGRQFFEGLRLFPADRGFQLPHVEFADLYFFAVRQNVRPQLHNDNGQDDEEQEQRGDADDIFQIGHRSPPRAQPGLDSLPSDLCEYLHDRMIEELRYLALPSDAVGDLEHGFVAIAFGFGELDLCPRKLNFQKRCFNRSFVSVVLLFEQVSLLSDLLGVRLIAGLVADLIGGEGSVLDAVDRDDLALVRQGFLYLNRLGRTDRRAEHRDQKGQR